MQSFTNTQIGQFLVLPLHFLFDSSHWPHHLNPLILNEIIVSKPKNRVQNSSLTFIIVRSVQGRAKPRKSGTTVAIVQGALVINGDKNAGSAEP